jgi:arylformamidase
VSVTETRTSGERGWIDVSVPLRSGMVHWPDNPPVRIERMLDMGRGDAANVSQMSFGSHTGTHMDAPVHFVRGGEGMDRMPLGAAMGRARVIEIQDPVSVNPDELVPQGIGRGERILFKTRNSARRWWDKDFMQDFVYVSQEAARHLADSGVTTVGVDYISVGGFYRDGPETHQALLGAGVWIIEGLDLSAVEPGGYELICLPIKVEGGDGAPARAILRRSDRG